MSDFFRAFNKTLGQRQRATMAYRPQANGSAERMVQTTTRAIKMYVQDLDQRDWDEYAERITFAINTEHDRIRGEPFYIIHVGSGDPVREDMTGIHDDGGIGSSGIISRFGNTLITGCERRSQIEWIYTTRRYAHIRSRSDLECDYI
ncbi:LOW QUALITY PROTEIN: Reverse transcriptase [Phytophthora palmivora]|uniref:Reverse transcriptase n=1 Tax=Phytophthora palmivora TaxID=4796 RepID=A0A2P4Y841_9STRA|nr:LOW QUALITY PROTEIN: Reverse transcriptase [Phytophthora palmivora]